MNASCHQSLRDFADWIRESDAHAAHHLTLIDRVETALASSSADEANALSEKLERWRYQHLHEHVGKLGERDEQFVDVLDWTAKQLSQSTATPARVTRHAVLDPAYDPPAASELLEALDSSYPLADLFDQAQSVTAGHFGVRNSISQGGGAQRRMLLYAPLYISSECVNFCTYCGFRFPLQIARKHLTLDEAAAEADALRRRNIRNVLIVGGDFPSRTHSDYYAELIKRLVSAGYETSLEIAPQTTESYAQLVDAGASGLTLYQETYDLELYGRYHPRGPKSSYHWRLEGHDRAAEAGMSRLGFGFLLGLADPREDLLAMMRHASYLARRFPGRTLAFSLPRLHEAPEGFETPHPVSDELLMRMYCALRLAFPRAELVLSTRESMSLRNRLADICITQMSAGSSTTPGGYEQAESQLGKQFPVADTRSPQQVAQWLTDKGFRPVWRSDEVAEATD